MAQHLGALLILLAAYGLVDAARVVVDAQESSSSTHLPLCDPEVVSEACALLDIANATSVDIAEVQEALSSKNGAVVELWDGLGFTGQSPSCLEFCQKLVGLLKSDSWQVPPTTDTACYEHEDGATRCDLDLSPQALRRDVRVGEEDLPDYHAGRPKRGSLAHPTQRERLQADAEGLNYTRSELLLRVANVFRIYPSLPISFEDGEGDDVEASGAPAAHPASLAQRLQWQTQIRKISVKAQASVSLAIRQMAKASSKRHLETWFGKDLRASDKKHIRMVLNSVDRMLGNVDYVYPGGDCETSTYAYVYPEGDEGCRKSELKEGACTTNWKDEFVFYMCPLTMKSKESVQMETLTHEGSHHATAYTDDVEFEGETAYGRSTCKKLAKKKPDLALNNADSYCYFIQDVFEDH